MFYLFSKNLKSFTVLTILSMHPLICKSFKLIFLHDFPVKLLFIVRIQLNSIDIYIYVYIFILGLNMSKKPSASETNLMTVNRGKMLPAKEGN